MTEISQVPLLNQLDHVVVDHEFLSIVNISSLLCLRVTPAMERSIEWVHTLGVSVEIELKMDWQGCKQVIKCQILHLSGQLD